MRSGREERKYIRVHPSTPHLNPNHRRRPPTTTGLFPLNRFHEARGQEKPKQMQKINHNRERTEMTVTTQGRLGEPVGGWRSYASRVHRGGGLPGSCVFVLASRCGENGEEGTSCAAKQRIEYQCWSPASHLILSWPEWRRGQRPELESGSAVWEKDFIKCQSVSNHKNEYTRNVPFY